MTSLPYPFIEACSDGVRLRVHLQPGAKKNLVIGTHGDSLKIQLMARPIEGEANKALTTFLAKKLRIKKNSITLVKGQSSRQKVILLSDYDVKEVTLLLKELLKG
jgi:hypothetical protein